MKRFCKRGLSWLLILTLMSAMIPAGAVAAFAAEPDTLALSNGYIKVVVSGDNGGFTIGTEEGDRLQKSDNNKRLLYHSGDYDTSFTSFRVTSGTKTEEFLFGGKYPLKGSTGVVVTKDGDGSGINAVWSVAGLTFTQRIELSASLTDQHGMAYISYDVKNDSGQPVEVKVRLLLDTTLGNKDYAYYNLPDDIGALQSVNQEAVFKAASYSNGKLPVTIYGTDDALLPSLTAYTVNSNTAEPYQVAFGHWNNLAATLFDFAPDNSMTFTNAYNEEYLTADSAYALYYDLGTVAAGKSGSLNTHYGVYSHETVADSDSVTIDITAPTSLELSADKQSYKQAQTGLSGGATFSVNAQLTNYVSETARDFNEVTFAVYGSQGINPLDGNSPVKDSYNSPYTIRCQNMTVGSGQILPVEFQAEVNDETSYRLVWLRAFDTSTTSDLTEQNLIGSTSFYILCPGGDGKLPQVTFVSAEPDILYYKGTRHFIVTGTGFRLLESTGVYTVTARSKDGKNNYKIAPSYVTFPEGAANNIADIILTEEMVPADYYLEFRWNAGEMAPDGTDDGSYILTAPALNFTVSDDPKYKADTYGVMAVYQTGSSNTSAYRIKEFRSEADFEKWKDDTSGITEIPIVLRGSFEVDTMVDTMNGTTPVSWTATCLSGGASAGQANRVTLNECIDFEKGTITVHYKENNLPGASGGGVFVDFDGDLYTSDARTSIWKGKAALTELKDGEEFSLVPYDKDGKRITEGGVGSHKPITLIWPCGLSLAQNLAGMVFNLGFGSLGVMKEGPKPGDKEVGRVLAFSANMNLGFLVPQSSKGSAAQDSQWLGLLKALSTVSDYYTVRYQYESYMAAQAKAGTPAATPPPQGQASVMVENILFGCGKGFLGFRCDADLKVPPYTDSMPTMSCRLSINTIGNWSFGVKGSAEFITISVEVDIQIKSKNNIPIPDKLYFEITGFEPGINVDSVGVLWITGGGGGIDKLYDTIFVSSALPPLKILLSVSFDLLKVLSADVDMSISLRGLSLAASDVVVKGTKIEVLKRAALQFDWYPNWYFMAGVSVSLLEVINGAGYIVVVDNFNGTNEAFVEFFVRAGVSVPGAIPIIGGIEVAGAELGVNTEKIWGVLSVIGIKTGVTYFWNGDFDWGVNQGALPTFPHLLSHGPIPLSYDEERGETLMMAVGNNFYQSAVAEVTEDFGPGAAPALMLASSALKPNADWLGARNMALTLAGHALQSKGGRLEHQLELGTHDADQILSLSYQAASLAEAQGIAEQITIKDSAGKAYPVSFYHIAPDTANANVTWNATTGEASMAVSFTNSYDFGKIWKLTTPVEAFASLLGVAALPEVSSISGTLGTAAGTVDASWSGTSNMNELDSISFYLTADPTVTADGVADMGTFIGQINDKNIIGSGSGSTNLLLPADLQSGDYYLRAVYTREGDVNGMVTDTKKISYTNSNQPPDPVIGSVSPGGDLTIDVNVSNTDGVDGYVLNVYDSRDELTDFRNFIVERNADGDMPALRVGGSYEILDNNGDAVTVGLTAGTYRVGVTAYKKIVGGNAVQSKEVISDPVTLTAPNPPTVTIGSPAGAVTLTRSQTWDADGDPATTHDITETVSTYEAYTKSDLTFTAGASAPVTGTWDLDDSKDADFSGSFSAQSTISIPLKGVSDGEHTLTLTGTNAAGDSFRVQETFAVDTKAPTLNLAAPINGSTFTETGGLVLTLVMDADAVLVIKDGSRILASGTPQQLGLTLNGEGVYSGTLAGLLDPGVASYDLSFTATDPVGHVTTASATVSSPLLAKLDRLDVYMATRGGAPTVYSNKNLNLSSTGVTTAQLSLMGVTTDNRAVNLGDSDLVTWSAQAVDGSATVDDKGLLTVASNSVGFVSGGLRVASTGSLNASATFGAERYSGLYQVVTGSTVGGTVTGAGYYNVGDTVTLTAVPDPGYVFSGWTVEGAALSLGSGPTASFPMPAANLTVTANFNFPRNVDYGDDDDDYDDEGWQVYAQEGELTTAWLPAGADPNSYVPVGPDGRPVALSAVVDGKMVFLAPAAGSYKLQKRSAVFSDVPAGHWAAEHIAFCAIRELFSGVGDGLFAPSEPMNRAMFVTVLWRLAGCPAPTGAVNFEDVEAGLWYSEAVAWAAENGTIKGYDNGDFGPGDNVTREQMCAIFLRYLEYAGYALPEADPPADFADSDQISPYARDAVSYLQHAGLINGKPGNHFDPLANSTRAEVSAVFERLIRAILTAKE